MEVRDRCNRALAVSQSGAAGSVLSDALNTARPVGLRRSLDGAKRAAHGGGSNGKVPGDTAESAENAESAESAESAEGCTVSANELAAACGFSRVTLWRLLQREDVRRFIQVEHNYVYDRRLGKKRRTVSTYRVLMEDPLVPEDEARLEAMAAEAQSQVQAQGQVARRAQGSVNTVNTEAGEIAAPTVLDETLVVDNSGPRFHFATNRGGSIPKPQNVPETIFNERLGTNVPEVDLWRRYPEIAHYVEEAEQLLGDTHSRGFYLKALKRLHPGHVGIWQRALGLAREQTNIRRSRGALFTRLLRTFAAEAGVTL